MGDRPFFVFVIAFCFVPFSMGKIFVLIMMHSFGEPHGEREVSAALESVFPRIGLKVPILFYLHLMLSTVFLCFVFRLMWLLFLTQSFVSLNTEEKRNQLNELGNIILGIRLFNKDLSKVRPIKLEKNIELRYLFELFGSIRLGIYQVWGKSGKVWNDSDFSHTSSSFFQSLLLKFFFFSLLNLFFNFLWERGV